ncbi:MAG: hypothetical protein QNK33_03065 [Bacteroidales bacterium]|nr:hypothetical protein [Bacteroidales bacterium]
MIIKNKIEKPFGPSATTAGVVIFFAGIIYTYYSLVGIILIVAGAFIGFTRVSTFIDTEKGRIKFSNVLFGIFPAGKWIDINDQMIIGLENLRRGFRTYSRGMRTNDTVVKDVRIVLYSSNKKKIGPIRKYLSQKSANEDLEELAKTLGVKIHKF